MAKLVSKTYGEALFAVAMEEDRLDSFYEAVKVLAELLAEHEEFGKLMNHPKVSGEEKIKILEETFSKKIPDEILGLFCLLVEKGHADQMIPVCAYFIQMVKKEKRIGEATVTSAVELSASQKDKVCQKLLETTGYQTLEIEYRVDAALIGGMVIRIGDRVVDSSVQTKLRNLAKDLRTVQV